MLNQSGQSSSTMGKCEPMQAIIARTLESFNHKETKMFLLTDKTFVSKLEFVGICYGGFIIPLIFCIYHMPFAQNAVIMSGLVLLVATWKCNNNVSHKNIFKSVGPSLTATFEPLAHCYKLHDFSVIIPRCYKDV